MYTADGGGGPIEPTTDGADRDVRLDVAEPDKASVENDDAAIDAQQCDFGEMLFNTAITGNGTHHRAQ